MARVVEHIDEVQTALGRTMLLENPSRYVRLAESTMPEVEFLAEVSSRTGCGLLLDVNNVFVSAKNSGAAPLSYLDSFPFDRVREIHLGGHHEETDEAGAPLLIDDHGSPVADAVWMLYQHVITRAGPIATLIEWDNDIPDWPTLRDEAGGGRQDPDRGVARVGGMSANAARVVRRFALRGRCLTRWSRSLAASPPKAADRRRGALQSTATMWLWA